MVLNFYDENESDESKMTTIAHELAHLRLGDDDLFESNPGGERAADDLCESWGFGRAYQDYFGPDKSAKQ